MMNCARTYGNLAMAGCRNAASGLSPCLIVLRRRNIQSITMAGGVVTDIRLRGTGRSYTTRRGALTAETRLAEDAYGNGTRQEVSCRTFLRGQAQKRELNAMKHQLVLCIVRRRDTQNADTRYEVYGLREGMELTVLHFSSADADGVVADFTFSTPAAGMEQMFPASLWAGTESDTEDIIRRLLGAGYFTLDVDRLDSDIPIA